MTDLEVQKRVSELIASAHVADLAAWEELRAQVRELAAQADHPEAVLVNAAEPLAFRRPSTTTDRDRYIAGLDLISQLAKDLASSDDEARSKTWQRGQDRMTEIVASADDPKTLDGKLAPRLARLTPISLRARKHDHAHDRQASRSRRRKAT